MPSPLTSVRKFGGQAAIPDCERLVRVVPKISDARLLVITAIRGVVFVSVPHGRVVHRINGHIAVITPAVEDGARFAARAIIQMGLTLSQSAEWISREPTSVADLGMDARAGGAIAHGQISRMIHRHAAHPAPGGVRLIGALLIDRLRSVRDIFQLEPARRCHCTRTDRKITYARLVWRRRGTKILIGHPEH